MAADPGTNTVFGLLQAVFRSPVLLKALFECSAIAILYRYHLQEQDS